MPKTLLIATVFWIILLSAQVMQAYASTVDDGKPNELEVTTIDNRGAGSLRQAILDANSSPGPDIISFSTENGPFAEPQVIVLTEELPALQGAIIINGYIPGQLWKASGVTVSGAGKHRIFRVSSGSIVTISHVTVADGQAETGGGIANEGTLTVKGVTFAGNEASRDGGGMANLGGKVYVINSTFAGNDATGRGGGMALLGGTATVTNTTFSENGAALGGGLFSSASLLLSNTILANSDRGGDCVSMGTFDPASTRNLVEINVGCGTPISSQDPRLETFGYYNGPTKTYPLGGGSPAINLGDNDSAVNEEGEPLTWDQRGNGDPRFVAGFTDIGAFERQAHAVLTVDTIEDTILRACTRAGREDCPLRGAMEIANVLGKPAVIRFDPLVYAEPQTISLTRPLPELRVDMTLDARDIAAVTIRLPDASSGFTAAPGIRIQLENVYVE